MSHTHTQAYTHYTPTDVLVCKCNLRPRAEIKTKIELWAAIRMGISGGGGVPMGHWPNRSQQRAKNKQNRTTKGITQKSTTHKYEL